MESNVFTICVTVFIISMIALAGWTIHVNVTKNAEIAKECIQSGGSWVDLNNLCINRGAPK